MRKQKCEWPECRAIVTYEVVGITPQGNKPGGRFCGRHADDAVRQRVDADDPGMWGAYLLPQEQEVRPVLAGLLTLVVAVIILAIVLGLIWLVAVDPNRIERIFTWMVTIAVFGGGLIGLLMVAWLAVKELPWVWRDR